MSDVKPPEKPTVSMKAVRPPDETAEPESPLDKILMRVDGLHTKVDHIAEGQLDLSARVGAIETWKEENEGRLRNHSGGVQRLSKENQDQDAELAKEREAREALAARVDELFSMVKEVRDSFLGIVNNPKVRAVAKVVWVLAMGYAVARGLINHNDAKAVLP